MLTRQTVVVVIIKHKDQYLGVGSGTCSDLRPRPLRLVTSSEEITALSLRLGTPLTGGPKGSDF